MSCKNRYRTPVVAWESYWKLAEDVKRVTDKHGNIKEVRPAILMGKWNKYYRSHG
jgi:hypothetical protein